MALRLELKPGEKIAINGAVIANGEKRAQLTVENRARVLRERDIMQPADANTPARRIYLPIMLMYLDPDQQTAQQPEFALRLTQFIGAVRDPACLQAGLNLAAEVANGNYYAALSLCRQLMRWEDKHLDKDTAEATPDER